MNDPLMKTPHAQSRPASMFRPLCAATALAAATATSFLLTGCGSTTKIQQSQSVGQQLQDLEKSYKDGIITEKEYLKLKKAIIREND